MAVQVFKGITLKLDSAVEISFSLPEIALSRSDADMACNFSICRQARMTIQHIDQLTRNACSTHERSFGGLGHPHVDETCPPGQRTSAFLASSQRCKLEGEHEGLSLVSACFFRLCES